MPDDVDAILEQLGIRELDKDIFEMSRTELRDNFEFENGNLNTSLLIKNLIWQDHGKLSHGELMPFHGNIRSYWYARVKPVLARARAKQYAKKYDMMIDQFVLLVMHHRLFSYADFGFTDEGAHNRRLGSANANIVCVAEKTGHLPLLQELQRDYDNTIVALGGQPSALSSEYFLSEINRAGFQPSDPILLLTIVDYDPAGDSIANSFVYQLKTLGFTGEITRVNLAHPDRMAHDQIRLNKYPLSKRKSERKKNQRWAARTGGLTAYGFSALYGLEADAMTWKQLIAAFDQEALPHLKVPRDQVVRRRLKKELVEVLKELLLLRLVRP
jgi:hypothetical protein